MNPPVVHLGRMTTRMSSGEQEVLTLGLSEGERRRVGMPERYNQATEHMTLIFRRNQLFTGTLWGQSTLAYHSSAN